MINIIILIITYIKHISYIYIYIYNMAYCITNIAKYTMIHCKYTPPRRIYIYIYICIQRERERCIVVYPFIDVVVYIYIYICV